MTHILILCTGNSCRSQMAEGFLRNFDPRLHVRSAGTNPSGRIHPKAMQVMAELGVDISAGKPENVDRYLNEEWDYVITVCDNARETCPVFLGKVNKQLHIGFEDPAEATGTEDEILSLFRRIRDEIKRDFYHFYEINIQKGEANRA
jgi:arsenate reductase